MADDDQVPDEAEQEPETERPVWAAFHSAGFTSCASGTCGRMSMPHWAPCPSCRFPL